MTGTAPSGRIAALGQVAVLVLAVLAASLGFVGVAAADAPVCTNVAYPGGGNTESPFEVSTVDQLQCIGAEHADATSLTDALSSDYVLTSDIDASGTASWNIDDGFDPIGDFGDQFRGTLNGQDHTIVGLTIDRPEENEVGLFGFSGGTIENIHLENIRVRGARLTGGLAGEQQTPSTIRSVSITGTVNGTNFVGGLAGSVQHDHVVNVTTEVDVDGNSHVGGLIGETLDVDVTGANATGTVNGTDFVGGLVGFVDDSYLSDVRSHGDVQGDTYVGGLIGESSQTAVEGALATGSVQSSEDFKSIPPSATGGLIGNLQGGHVKHAIATGDVSSQFGHVGGLVGFTRAGNITETAAFGSVTGTEHVGGLVGGAETQSIPIWINRSYAVGNISATDRAGGLVGTNRNAGAGAIVSNGYAIGSVSVSGSTSGGLVGQNLDGTVRDAYWSVNTTGQTDPIGFVNGPTQNLHDLAIREMVGLAPPETMDTLDFENTWTFSHLVPPLQFQAPDLSIEVTRTNSPVTVGETVEVDAQVTNHEDQSISSAVFVWIDNRTRNITPIGPIPAGGSETVTLTNSSEGVDPGTYTFDVATVNASSGPHEFTIEPAQDNESGVDVSPDVSSDTDGTDGETSDDADSDSEQDSEEDADEESEEQDGEGETTTAVQTSQQDGQTQVQATVQNARGGEPVEVQVASDAEADVDPDTAPAQLTSVSVTPAADATFSLDITESPEPLPSSPEFNLGDGTTPVSYLSVDHSLPNADIQEASITYRVSEQSLEAMDSSPEDVSMYRFEGDSWVEQPTQVVAMDDGAAILRATADGLSEWTAAAKRPRLNVTDTQVSVQAATTEEMVTIQVFVTNTGGTDGVYEAELLLNDETVDQTERTVPDGGTVAVNFERTFADPGLYEVQVNDVFVGEVNISAAAESVDVETAANASVEAQQPPNASDGGAGGGGGFPVVPAGLVLVLAAGLGVWFYMTRIAE